MRLSVVIPVFNREGLIGETLDSLIGQTRAPDEIIVVDDGSTDATCDVVSAYGERVKLIRQENAGAGAARNHGFAVSAGDVIHFMDSDDLSSPNTYEVQLKAISAGAEMVYGPWLKTRFDGKRLTPQGPVLQQEEIPAVPIDRLVLQGQWNTVFQPCIFRRELIDKAGPYRTDLAISQDIELLYRIGCAARSVVHTPETVVLYRVHPEEQLSGTASPKYRIDHAELWQQLSLHAALRSDLDKHTLALLKFLSANAAYDVFPLDPDLACSLFEGAAEPPAAAHRLRALSERINRKFRRLLFSDSYGRAFRVGALTVGQREQIALMGYSVSD